MIGMISRLALAALLSLTFTVSMLAADSKPSTNKEIAIQAMTDLFVYRDLRRSSTTA